ncbi:MAG: type IV toxin-antitoxin system AbiEi family antitoxin domain-containing protein [Thermoanaerobaculia bacterium]
MTAIEIRELLGTEGVLRTQDLERRGVPRKELKRLSDQGILEKIGRGLYRLSSSEITEHQSLLEASKRVPQGVVCLLSALRFHGLTTQNPFAVWLAIDRKAWQPRVDDPPLRIVRFSGEALTSGIETHHIQGGEIRVYSPAKTVADCFKYRNKIGLDVAMEALKDCIEGKRDTFDNLWKFAKICRVANVMRPYLESFG